MTGGFIFLRPRDLGEAARHRSIPSRNKNNTWLLGDRQPQENGEFMRISVTLYFCIILMGLPLFFESALTLLSAVLRHANSPLDTV